MSGGFMFTPTHTNLTDANRRTVAGLGVIRSGTKRRAYLRGLVPGESPVQPPPGHSDRVEAHAARVAAELAAGADPGGVLCWGPCGRRLPRGSTPAVHGWRVRPVNLTGYAEDEIHCPECHAAWGWIEPPAA